MTSRQVSQCKITPRSREVPNLGMGSSFQGGRPRLECVRSRVRSFVFLLAVSACLMLLLIPGRLGGGLLAGADAAATAPILLTQTNSNRGIALESVMETAEPFQLTMPVTFGGDGRTRVKLFATNLILAADENASAVTAEAQDATFLRYPLTVEYVGPVPGQTWLTAVVVRLNDNLGDPGDVLVGLTYQGMTSNRVRLGIGHVGGGPPDDPPVPTTSPTPTAGSATPGLTAST